MAIITKYILLTFLLLKITINLNSQNFPDNNYQYDFINYDINKIIFFKDSTNYNKLYDLFNNLILKGEGQIKILHIGDSHIQADYFSGHLRYLFQTYFQGNAGRGMVFPYRMARSNNPFNYSCDYTGKWETCRNIEYGKLCDLGILGISATTYDSVSSIKIKFDEKNYLKYDFNKFKIFYNIDSCFTIKLENYGDNYTVTNNDSLGYSEFKLNTYIDTLTLKFVKTDSLQKKFTFYGISFETDDPGIVYYSAGINGAEASSFLRCSLFSKQLKAISPDWVIISLGTNDSYSKTFDALQFYNNLENLLIRIIKEMPNAAILLTVPSDSYRKRKYKNTNISLAKNEIIKIAQKYNCGVWDLYDIMGGFNSIIKWQKARLTATDRLHFSRAGYYLQGDLLFDAFLKSYYNYIDYQNIKK